MDLAGGPTPVDSRKLPSLEIPTSSTTMTDSVSSSENRYSLIAGKATVKM